ARKIYRDHADETQLVLDRGLDAALLAKWVEYLKSGSQDRPHLADWDKPDERNLPQIALTYQTGFQQQLDKWTAVLHKWREEVRKAIAMNTTPPERPKFVPARDVFFYEVYFRQGPLAVSAKERESFLTSGTREKIASLGRELAQLKASAPPEPDMACA